MQQNHSSMFSLFFTVTLAPELSNVEVYMNWTNPDSTIFNSTTIGDIVLESLMPMMTPVNGNTVYTYNLNFSTFQASQVGEYTCSAMINQSIIKRSFPLSIQGND